MLDRPRRSSAGLCLLAASVALLGARPCAAVRLADAPSAASKADQYGLTCQHYSAENMHKHVTAIVSTSARKEDATGAGLQVLKATIGSIRDVLGLGRAQIVVAWDALPKANDTEGVQDLPNTTAHHYEKKLADFKAWNREELGGHVTIFENSEWTHQAEMLHRVFDFLQAKGTLTPMVYLAQDDSPVSGYIDVPFILHRLSCDPDVDYVRFLWTQDCSEGKTANWNLPCERHPRTALLHSVSRMSDRPHFATTKFYFEQIFPRCPRTYRGAPERKARGAKRAWLYGERHMMLHDANMLQDSFNDQPGSYRPKKSDKP